MKKALFIAVVAAAAAVGCRQVGPEGPAEASLVKIEPVITRATSTNFEQGDQIGLTIIKGDFEHASNACLTYDEAAKAFSGDLKWYAEGGEACSLKAFYPYQEAGFPESFTVALDQTSGAGASDFMAASKTGVLPQREAVAMNFKHYLSQIVIKVKNTADADIEYIAIRHLIPTADIAIEGDAITVTVAEGDEADIKAECIEANKEYRAIVVPQKSALAVEVKVKEGSVLVTPIAESELKQGYTYTVNAEVTPDNVNVSISGEIDNWEDGGTLDGGNQIAEISFHEYLEDGYIEYDNVKYTVAYMKDNNWWMTQNLAFVPAGYTPSSDLSNVKAGVYCPIVLNAAGTAVEFSDAAADVVSNGYLYQSEVALGLKVGDITTIEAAEALEGAQGICPKGWHLPTSDDILGLVGKAVSPLTTNTAAPYYDSVTSSGSIAMLNEDGFNAAAWGAVNINDNTRTAGTLMGYMSGYSAVGSGYLCGSTYAGVTYVTSGDATSGIKNIQFYGFMPMAKNGSFNGSKLSYRIGASVRCVRDVKKPEVQ